MNRTTTRVAIGGVVLLVLAVAGFLWWRSTSAAPEVELSNAADLADSDTTEEPAETPVATAEPTAPSAVGEAETSAGSGDLEGTWTIEPGNAESVNDGTFAGYRVDEELAQIGATTATGRTPEVTGQLTVEGGVISEVEVEADLTGLTSDQEFRDQALADRGLETSIFPTATFRLTQPLELPEAFAGGEPITIPATGDFTLHGVTQPVTLDLEAQAVDGDGDGTLGDRVVVVGSLPILLTDYDIEAPTSARVLSINEQGTAELQLLMTRG